MITGLALVGACTNPTVPVQSGNADSAVDDDAVARTEALGGRRRQRDERCSRHDGKCIFRHDTFGDEQLWTDVLRLHELVQTLPPTTALAVGLKVDSNAVPAELLASADLNDPAVTVELLARDAVVGLQADVQNGRVESIALLSGVEGSMGLRWVPTAIVIVSLGGCRATIRENHYSCDLSTDWGSVVAEPLTPPFPMRGWTGGHARC